MWGAAPTCFCNSVQQHSALCDISRSKKKQDRHQVTSMSVASDRTTVHLCVSVHMTTPQDSTHPVTCCVLDSHGPALCL